MNIYWLTDEAIRTLLLKIRHLKYNPYPETYLDLLDKFTGLLVSELNNRKAEIKKQERDKNMVKGLMAEHRAAQVLRHELKFKDHDQGRQICLNYFHGERTDTALCAAIHSVSYEGKILVRIELNKKDWNQVIDEWREGLESNSKCSAIAEGETYFRDEIIRIEVIRKTGTDMKVKGIPTTRGESTKFFFGKPE